VPIRYILCGRVFSPGYFTCMDSANMPRGWNV